MPRKPPPNPKPPARIFELRITLSNSKPPIWRRVAVASNINLGILHAVIQVAMGWTNAHLHQFLVPNPLPKPTRQEISQLGNSGQWEKLHKRMSRDRSISDPAFELEDAEDEFAITLEEIAPTVKSKLTYWYDFGDDWYHRIDVVKIGPPVESVAYPVCLAGKLACPPEDCGGVWGYYEMLEALKDPQHENHENMVEGIGSFDPERFDIDEVNAALVELR